MTSSPMAGPLLCATFTKVADPPCASSTIVVGDVMLGAATLAAAIPAVAITAAAAAAVTVAPLRKRFVPFNMLPPGVVCLTCRPLFAVAAGMAVSLCSGTACRADAGAPGRRMSRCQHRVCWRCAGEVAAGHGLGQVRAACGPPGPAVAGLGLELPVAGAGVPDLRCGSWAVIAVVARVWCYGSWVRWRSGGRAG